MLKTPTGLIDYAKMKENDYYTGDKTMLINDFLDDGKKVTLITRPKRFGKTINMSMMAKFFGMTKDSKNLFKGTNIMEMPYAKEMNQWPTIFISFANAKDSINIITCFVRESLRQEYKKYRNVLSQIDFLDQDEYQTILKI